MSQDAVCWSLTIWKLKRVLMRSGLLFASVVAAVTLMPSSGWATTAKDCPTEPKQGVGIGSGQTYYGGHCVLNTASEIDGFQFTASAGDTWSVVLGLGPSPPTDICMTVYGPGNPPPIILPKSCTFAHNLVYAVAANLPLTASGTTRSMLLKRIQQPSVTVCP